MKYLNNQTLLVVFVANFWDLSIIKASRHFGRNVLKI